MGLASTRLITTSAIHKNSDSNLNRQVPSVTQHGIYFPYLKNSGIVGCDLLLILFCVFTQLSLKLSHLPEGV